MNLTSKTCSSDFVIMILILSVYRLMIYILSVRSYVNNKRIMWYLYIWYPFLSQIYKHLLRLLVRARHFVGEYFCTNIYYINFICISKVISHKSCLKSNMIIYYYKRAWKNTYIQQKKITVCQYKLTPFCYFTLIWKFWVTELIFMHYFTTSLKLSGQQ